MISQSLISSLVQEKAANSDYYLIDVNVSSSNQIQVEIDSDQGVKINDCVELSRHIENSLDREEEDFELTVTSAGLDQPLKILRQYQRYLGRQMQVITREGINIKGKLISASEKNITMETVEQVKRQGKKKKEKVNKIIDVPMEQVKETKVVISFK